MTTLTFENYPIISANLGEESCLADIHVNSYIRAPITVSDKIVGEDAKYVGKGMISTLLPYTIFDGYDRERKVRLFKGAILENEYVRAVFLPEIGGRLWSLVDKSENRELLYKNDVFQPANLALTNAWFSGGVEWNVGIKGHNPLTCCQLFAQKEYDKDGNAVLKMYEYERIRGVVYCIRATLKDKELLVKISIENTLKNDVYMYWWSNIAVPETEKTRVIAPCDKTFYCAYTDGGYFLDKTSMPYVEGKDITYSKNSNRSRDFFFDTQNSKEKWICAVDEHGKGLLQVSDPILKGRKLFVWGQHQGGRHWNKWLSNKAGAYVEIQAGLLKTQLEHFVMKAQSEIVWHESYSLISMDSNLAHGEFVKAVQSASEIAKERMKDAREAFETVKSDEIEQIASGWGFVEEKIRGEKISKYCSFPSCSVTNKEKEWLDLISLGILPERNENEPIKSYNVDAHWIPYLENAKDKNWYVLYQLATAYYANGEFLKSEETYKKSIQQKDNAWAQRNIAMLYKNVKGEASVACQYMAKAYALKKDYLPLVIEYAQTLINAKKYGEWIDLYDTLCDEFKQNGRLKMLLCACYVKVDELEKAKKMLTKDFVVCDIKEGEYSLSAIWQELYAKVIAKDKGVDVSTVSEREVFEKYPLFEELDFRMH